MELVLYKGRRISADGDEEYFSPGARLDLGFKQVNIIAAALRLAVGRIEEEIGNDSESTWDGNDIPLIEDAIEQLDEADAQLTAYFEQNRK